MAAFTFPPKGHKCSNSSVVTYTLFSDVLVDGLPDGCEVASHWGLNLCFSND